MLEGIVTKAIRRSNRTLLALSVVGILAVLALVALNTRYFYNFILGPAPVTADEVTGYTGAGQPQRYWVTVTGEEVYDTGIQYVNQESGKETVENSYLALVQNDRLLLVKVPGEAVEQTTFTGWLAEMSDDEYREIVQSIETDQPELTGVFLPFMLETGNFRLNGILGIVIGLGVLAACVVGLVKGIRRSGDPNEHPIARRLARLGPVDFVISRIEGEMTSNHLTLGKAHLTANWLVFAPGSDLQAARFEDIAWIYKHVTTYRTYGIPVSKRFVAKVFDRFGGQMTIEAGNKESKADELVRAIYERAPWALAGFTPDLEKAWKKDRTAFLDAVEQRRKAAANPDAALNR
ncbi:hypothetical protein LARV_03787 [Longilinea arvoryzae]|uniref:Uncharacterized protein n=1 Tax=Longilinea arvoryzae TaxID=360412 RepID=A0A0K8MZD2_9CHLR|nr:DUF6709 family protein [Longilinea arvoryzae]GAP15992.1 hypothetical protein LARV_03787 [Longilinea arvoryzae]